MKQSSSLLYVISLFVQLTSNSEIQCAAFSLYDAEPLHVKVKLISCWTGVCSINGILELQNSASFFYRKLSTYSMWSGRYQLINLNLEEVFWYCYGYTHFSTVRVSMKNNLVYYQILCFYCNVWDKDLDADIVVLFRQKSEARLSEIWNTRTEGKRVVNCYH